MLCLGNFDGVHRAHAVLLNKGKQLTRELTAKEGKTLAGWFVQDVDAEGNTTYSLVFEPAEDGSVKLPAGYVLEPMELHALFEEAK